MDWTHQSQSICRKLIVFLQARDSAAVQCGFVAWKETKEGEKSSFDPTDNALWQIGSPLHSHLPHEMSGPSASPQESPGESGWALACKALFWFIALPMGLIMLLKWLLALERLRTNTAKRWGSFA
jgi:hypothetical protein